MMAVLTVVFFFTLFLMCLNRHRMDFKVWNIIFIILDIGAFFAWNYAAYLHGWLKTGWMTLGNISPFIFTVIPLTLFMSEKVRSYAYSAIAFLSVGMFIAMLVTPNLAYLVDYEADANFLHTSEAVCHLVCALYGLFLALAGKVKTNFKHWVKSMVFMYSVIAFGVFLNFVFHTDNFGMDPYGGYRIYMINIFGSFWATLGAYIAGVCLVLTVGLQFCHLLEYISIKAEQYIGHMEPPPLVSLEETIAAAEKAEAIEKERELKRLHLAERREKRKFKFKRKNKNGEDQ